MSASIRTLIACRNGTLPLPKSERGALRQYATLYRQYRTAHAGGFAFGADMPTLRVNEPEAYARMKYLYETYPNVGR